MKDKEFTIDDQIAILKAYKEGKTLQFHNFIQDEWYDLEEKDHLFNFNENVYRVKPEATYRPYQSAEEVLEDIKEKGMFVMHNEISGNYQAIKRITCEKILLENEIWQNFKTMLSDYTWSDGTPFGRKECGDE